MASKRKHSGRTMMDVIRESTSNASDHEFSETTRSGSDTSASIRVKKGRGPNKPVAKWGSGQKFQLELTTTGDIDGPDRAKFKTQLGVMARNAYNLPPIYEAFNLIPQHVLDDIWLEIKV
ncbi:hypothetical protein CDL12_14844 [Handroanthus impetiginosus]|uniref:Uncharacterized protein n=1 Tax=Handroanthus impetiginosus TaxID=429701 RepID=A0A2G9H4X4_9LAMI|nr:hypothetical protein CDL12_14844 [Handroanthus impetiginosus]